MIMGHYMKVSELPTSVQNALRDGGYGGKDIEVIVSERFEPRPPSGKGRRGYVAACRLDDSNEHKLTWGSYGGSNMFTRTIDDVDEIIEIPQNIAFVSGLSNAGPGYPGYATVHISPKNMNPALLPPTASVSEKEAKILAIFKSLKSSARKEYLDRAKATPAEVDSLVARGFLSRNRAGATSITTEGRNAAGKSYY
jgi:hypothetical protein